MSSVARTAVAGGGELQLLVVHRRGVAVRVRRVLHICDMFEDNCRQFLPVEPAIIYVVRFVDHGLEHRLHGMHIDPDITPSEINSNAQCLATPAYICP